MKPIILTDEAKANALELFKKLLNEAAGSVDLKINITTDTLLQQQGVEKPTVFVTTNAYLKMITLINNSDKELAWYGTVSKVLHNYLIEDIYVYPQTVTAATVDADEEKCAKWFMELPDDVINRLRFQGHSHVNMSVTPSGRDTGNWQQFANLLKPNEFYILCIGNKRGEFYWNIYDRSINVYFENKDISMCVIDDQGNSIKEWAQDSVKKYIEEHKPTTVTPCYKTMYESQTFNGHQYAMEPEKKPEKKPKTAKDYGALRKGMAAIPARLKNKVDYELETDMYYCDENPPAGFHYSGMWGCYIMTGEDFRDKYCGSEPKKDKKTK